MLFTLRRALFFAFPLVFLLPLALGQTPLLPQPSVKERPSAPTPTLIPSTEKIAPRLEAVAETKLLMQGLTQPNIEGLAKLLREKPTNAESWTFARGQALLIAETGNLLMMRPPKAKAAQDAWLARTTDLRTAATKLATAAGEKDYVAARAGLAGVANVCNKCHESFGIKTRVAPFE